MRVLPQNAALRGFIFDMDGTLLDSMPAWQRQLDDLLRSRGIEPPADLLDRTKTLGLESATGMVLREFHLPDDPAEVYRQIQAHMADLYRTTIPLKPGVAELLPALRDAGYPMAVATATARPLAEYALDVCGLRPYFQSITTVAEVGVGKHDPRIFLTAAEKLRLAPACCAVAEDSLKAIQSARRAGFFTVAISEATNPAEQAALRREADRYVDDFRALLP